MNNFREVLYPTCACCKYKQCVTHCSCCDSEYECTKKVFTYTTYDTSLYENVCDLWELADGFDKRLLVGRVVWGDKTGEHLEL